MWHCTQQRNVYVGETARSLKERASEHIRDGRKWEEDSHMAKHWGEEHEGEEMPEFPFRFKLVSKFTDCLTRQLSECVRVEFRTDMLNSKSVYSRNTLPRLVLEKPEWMKEPPPSKKEKQGGEQHEDWEKYIEQQEDTQFLKRKGRDEEDS